MGIAEVIGYICLTIASRDDVAVASVLVSQFAPIAAVVAFLLFKERLGRLQIAGLVVIIIGVVGLSIVQTTT
jgi:drug/metabolite transporter (DMT)-like permease